LALDHLPDSELVERLLAALPAERGSIECEVLRRAADDAARKTLVRMLEERAQEADEYLGVSAQTARHYLARLTAARPEGVDG